MRYVIKLLKWMVLKYFFFISAFVCEEYRQYGSLTTAKILKKKNQIEYLNTKCINTFPGQKKFNFLILIQYEIYKNYV